MRLGLLGFVAMVGCGGASFSSSSHWSGKATDPDKIKVFSEHHDRTGFREVGFVNASGSSFDAAVQHAKEVGAEHGCQALGIENEAITSQNAAGSAWGGSKTTLRLSCLVADSSAMPKPSASAPAANACVPSCRSGYDCIEGSCLSACNPACRDGRTCKGHGDDAECVTE